MAPRHRTVGTWRAPQPMSCFALFTTHCLLPYSSYTEEMVSGILRKLLQKWFWFKSDFLKLSWRSRRGRWWWQRLASAGVGNINLLLQRLTRHTTPAFYHLPAFPCKSNYQLITRTTLALSPAKLSTCYLVNFSPVNLSTCQLFTH